MLNDNFNESLRYQNLSLVTLLLNGKSATNEGVYISYSNVSSERKYQRSWRTVRQF